MRSRRSKTAGVRTDETRQGRAALWTVQLAVDAVADAIRRLDTLRCLVYRTHQAALSTLRTARHHPLKDPDLAPLEDRIGHLANRLDWPQSIRSRTHHHEHLERPLTRAESRVIGNWAGSAFAVTSGMLNVSEQLDAWYAGLVTSAVRAARTASSRVTVEAHKRRAEKLLRRLDQLCADERIAWAFAVPNGEDDDGRLISGRTLQ
jgi:hypothetical protein